MFTENADTSIYRTVWHPNLRLSPEDTYISHEPKLLNRTYLLSSLLDNALGRKRT